MDILTNGCVITICDIKRGVVEREHVGTAFPHLFHVKWKWVRH